MSWPARSATVGCLEVEVDQGNETWTEQGDAAKRRHRIGALQDLSRARTNLEHATSASTPDAATVARLEEIEQELAAASRTAGARSRKRNERRVLDLLLSERLLLDQLGFATYAELAQQYGSDASTEDADLTDLAYLEFARMELESAQRRLDALDRGELDPDVPPHRAAVTGELEAYLVVPARTDPLALLELGGDPLEAWVAPAPGDTGEDASADTTSSEQTSPLGADGRALPHLGTTDLDDLALPYWDETA